jgi:hypothetical protein
LDPQMSPYTQAVNHWVLHLQHLQVPADELFQPEYVCCLLCTGSTVILKTYIHQFLQTKLLQYTFYLASNNY